MDLTIQRHGRLNILANVAAWGAFAPFDEMNYQSQWGEEGLVADSGSDQSAISARNAGRGLGDNSIAASALIPVMHSSRTTTWRSEERRVGKEGVSTCRSGWSP